MIFEAAKVAVVVFVVFIMDMGLYGADRLSVYCICCQARGPALTLRAQNCVRASKYSELRRWLKLSWITAYYAVPRFVVNLDVMVYTLITGSVIGVAYFGAAMVIAGVVMHSKQVTQALYPKLLSGGKSAAFQENFALLLYFAIPILGVVIIFSKPAMFALNPVYADGYLLAVFFGIRTLFLVFNEVFRSVLLGIEDVDVEKNASFKLLAKSMLFFSSSIWLVKSIVSIIALIAVLYLTNTAAASEIDLVLNWSITVMAVDLMLFAYLVIILRKKVKFKVPIRSVLRYAAATGVFAAVYYMTSGYIIDYRDDVAVFVLRVMLQLVLCAGTYLAVTYAIDKRTRNLVRAVLNEVR